MPLFCFRVEGSYGVINLQKTTSSDFYIEAVANFEESLICTSDRMLHTATSEPQMMQIPVDVGLQKQSLARLNACVRKYQLSCG